MKKVFKYVSNRFTAPCIDCFKLKPPGSGTLVKLESESLNKFPKYKWGIVCNSCIQVREHKKHPEQDLSNSIYALSESEMIEILNEEKRQRELEEEAKRLREEKLERIPYKLDEHVFDSLTKSGFTDEQIVAIVDAIKNIMTNEASEYYQYE